MTRVFGLSEFLLILAGVKWTLALSAIAFAGGLPGGIVIALARSSSAALPRSAAAAFIEMCQGTPLLLQLFTIYYGIALSGLQINQWLAVAIALTIHASAYLGEIWRGCIAALPPGQREAGTALGLSYANIMRLIILPQAIRMSLPATVGFLVQLIKGTSLASLIGFVELTRAGQLVANATFQPMITYTTVGIIYFGICWPLSLWAGELEGRERRPNR